MCQDRINWSFPKILQDTCTARGSKSCPFSGGHVREGMILVREAKKTLTPLIKCLLLMSLRDPPRIVQSRSRLSRRPLRGGKRERTRSRSQFLFSLLLLNTVNCSRTVRDPKMRHPWETSARSNLVIFQEVGSLLPFGKDPLPAPNLKPHQ